MAEGWVRRPLRAPWTWSSRTGESWTARGPPGSAATSASRGDRIAAITPAGGLGDADAGLRVDAAGKVVSPGFIDIQSHARGPLLSGDGRLLGKITQGITTEIMGEGWTNAPANANTEEGAGLVDPEAQGARHDFSGPSGFGRWLNAMAENGGSPNFGSFVGATTVRVYAMGEVAGPASEAQLDTMRAVTRWAMEDGAFGLASALIYPPGNFAGTDELAEVVAASAPYGGVYITHMRSEADRFLEAIDEAIEIGERAGVPVEIYHLKAAGVRNHYKSALAIAKIDSARAAGVDVQANMYPYTGGRHRHLGSLPALGVGGRSPPGQPVRSGDAETHSRRRAGGRPGMGELRDAVHAGGRAGDVGRRGGSGRGTHRGRGLRGDAPGRGCRQRWGWTGSKRPWRSPS